MNWWEEGFDLIPCPPMDLQMKMQKDDDDETRDVRTGLRENQREIFVLRDDTGGGGGRETDKR